MYKSILLFLGMFFLGITGAKAQLAVGDIAFLGMNTDAQEGYAFITLADIPGSEVIFFSDRGIINPTSYITFVEGTYKFTAPAAGISCGTIVSFQETSANVMTISGVTGASMTLSAGSANLGAGDQIYAYQTATDVISANPSDASFIAGIMCDYDAGCIDASTKWTQSSCVSNTSECIVPPGLTNGTNCISITPSGPEVDNMKYTGSLTGTSTALRASINNFNNWATNNSPAYSWNSPGDFSSPSVTCVVACTTPPTAVCQNITIFLDGSGNATITPSDLDGGSTVVCGPATFSASKTSFNCGDVGSNTVSFTVTDANSNTSSCNATVTVSDTISPTASCQNITAFLSGAGNVSISALDINNGSSDNCALAAFSVTPASFTCADVGPNNVTFTATDVNGNTSTCTAVVTVSDTISPTASCQNITVFLDGAGTASITAADLDNGSSDNCTTVTLAATPTSFTCADLGSNTVTLTVTDGSGNTSTCTSTVTVSDTISPTVSCQNITVFLDGTGTASITAADLDNGSTDNCTTVSFAATPTAFTCANVGANTVTLTVTDGSGNTSTCTSTVTVSDTISPTAVCQPFTVNLDGAGNGSLVAADIDGGSSDNCGAVTLAASQTTFTCADAGTVNVTLTATDVNGNSSTCTAVVTVVGSSATGTDVQSACGTYFWIDGNTYTASTNTPTFTIVGGAASGCDSIVTLDLTITTAGQVMNVSSTNITTTTAEITWDAMTLPVTGSFAIEYRVAGTLPWLSGTFATSVNTSAVITGLTAGTTYESRVTASCSTGQPGTPSATHTFTTVGGSCIDPMVLSQVSNSGNSVTITWVPVPTIGWYEFRYKESSSAVWLNGGTINSAATSKMIFGLNASTSYDFEGRRFCPATGAWSSTLTITTDALSGCNVAPAVTASTVTGSSATITWAPVPSAGWYQFRYKESSSAIWIAGGSASGAATSKSYTGLNPGTAYDFEGRTNCTNGTFSPWGATTFTTTPNSGCELPPVLDPVVLASTTTSITIGWAAVTGAAWYTFQYKESSSVTWINGGSASGSATSKTYAGLSPFTSYDFQVKTYCPNGAGSDWSSTGTYSTGTPPTFTMNIDSSNDKVTVLDDKALAAANQITNVYPNPATEKVNIDIYMDAASDNSSIHLLDMSGRLVREVSMQTVEGLNTFTMDLQGLSDGLYTMHVYQNGSLMHTAKVKKK